MSLHLGKESRCYYDDDLKWKESGVPNINAADNKCFY